MYLWLGRRHGETESWTGRGKDMVLYLSFYYCFIISLLCDDTVFMHNHVSTLVRKITEKKKRKEEKTKGKEKKKQKKNKEASS